MNMIDNTFSLCAGVPQRIGISPYKSQYKYKC